MLIRRAPDRLNKRSIRTVGGKAWGRLQKLSYAAVAPRAPHFIMIKKVWLAEPVVYALSSSSCSGSASHGR